MKLVMYVHVGLSAQRDQRQFRIFGRIAVHSHLAPHAADVCWQDESENYAVNRVVVIYTVNIRKHILPTHP